MHIVFSLLTFFLLALSLPVAAKIKIVSISGASKAEFGDDVTTPVIFGGLGGDDCSSEVTTSNTCNNCDDLSTLEVCNEKRIYEDLELTIRFQSDSESGEPTVKASDSGDELELENSPGSKPKGETHTVVVTWNEICNELNDQTTCKGTDDDHNFEENMIIGVGSDTATISVKVHDPDPSGSGDSDTLLACEDDSLTGEGVCDFTAFPGDGKVYITDIGSTSGFPNVGNIKVEALRFYIQSETDLNRFVNSPNESIDPAELTVEAETSGDVSTTSKIIDRLENGTKYFFRVAAVDQAQNVFGFTSDQAIDDYCGDVNSPDVDCRFTARPDEVLGMLTEDFNCFIATAAYGSPLDQRLQVFRDFRSKVLRKIPGGQALIDFYYKKGPYAARWIWDKPWAKSILQVFLWPAYGFAWLSLQWGVLPTTSLLLILLTGLGWLGRQTVRTRKRV